MDEKNESQKVSEKEKSQEAEKTATADTDDRVSSKENPLDEAQRLNNEKAALLDREEKLIARRERLAAEEMVGGRASAGSMHMTKEEEFERKAKERGDEIVNAFR